MCEYQHHSKEAEAAWRVQDEKHSREEREGSEREDSRTKRTEGKDRRQGVPGEALWREIREGTAKSTEK